jgi:hypothetical protein
MVPSEISGAQALMLRRSRSIILLLLLGTSVQSNKNKRNARKS